MTGPRDPLHDALLDLEASAPAGPPPYLHRDDRRPWIVVGGLLATAAVIGGLLIGSGILDRSVGQATPSPTTPLSTSVASPTPAPTSSPEPTASPAPHTPIATASPDAGYAELEIVMRQGTDETLQYVVGFGHGTAGRVAAVNVRDGATVAATGPWRGSGAIYLETDDGTWERVDTGNTFKDVGFTRFLSPLRGPMVLYGVPADAEQPRDISGAWTSTDGRTWTEVATSGAEVGVGPLGYVMAATVHQTATSSNVELHWSADALNWELVHVLEGGQFAATAAGGGPEGFVVVARDLSDDGGPIILASGDGRNWIRASEQPALTDDDVVMTVAPIGTDWVAAGWRSVSGLSEGIDLWWSADGLNWEQTGSIAPPDDIEPFGTRVMYPSHLISRGDTLFLSGARAVEGSETRPLGVWISTDGRSWEEMDLGGPAEVRAVDGVECCFWLGGRLGMDDGEAVIWRWDPSAR